MINILFFASLREALGQHKIELFLDNAISLVDLRLMLIEQHPAWAGELMKKNLLMAINKQQVNIDAFVHPGDEVAFFPPVTGG